MSDVVLTVEAFTDRNIKSPEEMILTLQRNIDKILALPDQEINRFLVNYIIRLAKSVTESCPYWELNYSDPLFWVKAMEIQQQKENRKNGLA